ncbi:copia protein [Tanacetum coccineum]
MAMSEVFDRKLCELLANLARKCTSARLLLEEKKVGVCEIAGEIVEAEGLIRKMELEARSLTKDVKAKVVVKLGEYRNDVKKLKSELAKLRSCSATQATLGNIHTVQGYSNQRGRLVTSIDNVHRDYNADRSKKTSSEPKDVNEALKDESWVVAMQEELNQFVANDVWYLVPLPMSQSVIGTKWVFRNKLDENGIVSRNKARLEDSKPTKTPMSMEVNLTKDDEADFVDSTKYRGDYVGVCTFMGCCLTSWFAKKQTALAISTTEAEYASNRKACPQALWMKQALIDYDIRLDDIPIMCNNKGAIDLCKNLIQHSRTKHIEIRHHFLCDNIQKGNISIEKVASKDNIADILTKPLKREVFNYL